VNSEYLLLEANSPPRRGGAIATGWVTAGVQYHDSRLTAPNSQLSTPE
jgi:hypothetical protein